MTKTELKKLKTKISKLEKEMKSLANGIYTGMPDGTAKCYFKKQPYLELLEISKELVEELLK